MKTNFSPVNPDYYDLFSEEKEKEFSKVFYFENVNDAEEAKGKITGLVKKEAFEEYLAFE